MHNGASPRYSHESADDTLKRAAAQGTDPLTLLEIEDALSAIPDGGLTRSEEHAIS
jgi:hypothetical protein